MQLSKNETIVCNNIFRTQLYIKFGSTIN